jgi:hypothetical protein
MGRKLSFKLLALITINKSQHSRDLFRQLPGNNGFSYDNDRICLLPVSHSKVYVVYVFFNKKFNFKAYFVSY